MYSAMMEKYICQALGLFREFVDAMKERNAITAVQNDLQRQTLKFAEESLAYQKEQLANLEK